MSSLGKFSKVRRLNDGTPVNVGNTRPGQAVSVGVLTISDRCSRGIKEDFSGPNLQRVIQEHKGFRAVIKAFKIVPDEGDKIEKTLIQWSDSLGLDLIVTTGGTGLGPRDVTPEATVAVVDRETPGFSIAIITESLKVTKDAMVTRLKSGIRGKTIIINLPGSKKASDECVKVILPAIPHALECLRDEEERICDCTVEDISSKISRQKLIQSVTTEVEQYQRKVASQLENDDTAAAHHHHGGLQPLNVEITGDDLNLDDLGDDLDVESLISGNILSSSNNPDSIKEDIEEKSPSGKEFPAISVNKAFDLALEKTRVLNVEEVATAGSFGRTLAEDVGSPKASNLASATNGYAITGSILKGETRVLSNNSKEVGLGQAGQVNVGAVMPSGTNTVIPLESTQIVDGNKIKVIRTVIQGQGTESVDFKASVTLPKGTKLGPAQVGKLTLTGIKTVKTYKNPLVAVLSIGDKDVEVSNHVTLQLSLQQHSVTPIDLGITQVDAEKLSASLTDAIGQADVIICAGESLKGRELARTLIEKKFKGVTHFGNVSIKPWKPSYFSTANTSGGQKIFFIVPECPTASILSTLFLIPVFRKMSGIEEPGHTILKAKVPEDIQLKEVPEYQQCQVSWIPGESLPVIGNQVGSPQSNSDANALLLLPARSSQVSQVKRGDSADILLISRI